jgi:hypothetical protein
MNLQWKNSAFWQKAQNMMCPALAVELKETTRGDLVAQAMLAFATAGPKMADVFLYSKYSFLIDVFLIVPIA